MADITTTAQPTTHLTTGPPGIRSAGPDELPMAARTLARAFQDDPVFGWCIPDTGRRAAVLPAVFEVFAGAAAPFDTVQIAADAAAIWLPPQEAAEAPDDDDDDAVVNALAPLLGGDAQRTFTLMAELDEHHPTEPHWYLFFLGVAPGAQGQGRGSALLAATLDTCDRDGIPAYLDATSPDNRRLYERHGFEVVGTCAVDGSPTLWAMWREAR